MAGCQASVGVREFLRCGVANPSGTNYRFTSFDLCGIARHRCNVLTDMARVQDQGKHCIELSTEFLCLIACDSPPFRKIAMNAKQSEAKKRLQQELRTRRQIVTRPGRGSASRGQVVS